MRSLLETVSRVAVEVVATGRLAVDTPGNGFFEITKEVRRFVAEVEAADGILFVYVRHTSASVIIQENADPDVRLDLTTALDRLAPQDAGWIHDSEGPDDMPSHVKSMLTGTSLHVPVMGGSLGLGTWQGIYLAEHRALPHRREVVLQYVGSVRRPPQPRRTGSER